MQCEILILAITIFLVANTYYDGKLIETLKGWQKYYQMGFFVIAGIGLYLFIKNNPHQGRQLFANATEVVRTLPIDKQSKDILTPLFNFSQRTYNPSTNYNYENISPQQKRMMNSGNQTTKRSVSETKKKYIASQQDWKCGDCKTKLPAWFEVDHIVRLDHGGSNNVDNLVALCRNCHGKKTAYENF